MNRLIVSLCLATLLAPLATHADDCDFTADRTVTLDARGLERLALEMGAGDLNVRAEPGLARIEARGRACANDEETLAAIQLVARGGSAIVAEIPSLSFGWGDDEYAYMDVEVRVPEALALAITDSSGDINVRGATVASVHDSSGDIEIEDGRGALRLKDSSGDIDVRAQSGAVTVDVDSSGDIEIEQVAGDVTIASDSSGEIMLRRVDGNARVERDSSGEIRFDGIANDAFVGTDSSGSIVANDVGGNFTVRSDGSGSIDHSGVRGRVDVPEED